MQWRAGSWPIALAVCMALPAQAGAQADRDAKMSLVSAAFAPGGGLPSKYTCEGAGVSPPLSWSGVPATAKSLVLIVDDPDAPDPAAPKRTWTHWVLYDLPATSTGLTEGVGGSALPAGTREGKNDWGRSGFGGACPPIGRHRYFHKLYALDVVLGDLHAPDRQAVDKAMKGHVIAQVQLIATYAKHPGG